MATEQKIHKCEPGVRYCQVCDRISLTPQELEAAKRGYKQQQPQPIHVECTVEGFRMGVVMGFIIGLVYGALIFSTFFKK